MVHNLESTFRELGLSQYLDSFVDQGFDTWDIILDIQESDLDALGVKLGHRRKLQRRIANARGIAPSISLSSTPKPGSDETRQDGARPVPARHDCAHDGAGVTKRKYRRHPKPDENAPERPPSAYVLFSNKMREDLKSQNLTFTEIAKLVGENWQCLPANEKEAYESQANTAKDKYHRDLAAYKKTPEYRKYTQYLQEFKEKQSKQGVDAKRSKVEPARMRHSSTSSSVTHANGGSGSRSRSSSERAPANESSSPRRERFGSSASNNEPQAPSNAMAHHSRRLSLDDPAVSPRTSAFEPISGRRSVDNAWNGNARMAEQSQQQQPLPSLSDILDDGRSNPISIRAGREPSSSAPGFLPINQQRSSLFDAGPTSRVPHLRHESSSNSTSASGSSASSYAQSSIDVPLPGPPMLPSAFSEKRSSPPFGQKLSPILGNAPSAPEQALPSTLQPGMMPSYGLPNPSILHPITKVEQQSSDNDVVMSAAGSTSGLPPKRDCFDGMSALLRAGEIVGQQRVPL